MWGYGVKIVSHKGLLSLAALRNLPHDPVNKLRLVCWLMRDTGDKPLSGTQSPGWVASDLDRECSKD